MSLRSPAPIPLLPGPLGRRFPAESGRRAVFGADGTADGGARSIDSRRFAAIDAAANRQVSTSSPSVPTARHWDAAYAVAADRAAAIMVPPPKVALFQNPVLLRSKTTASVEIFAARLACSGCPRTPRACPPAAPAAPPPASHNAARAAARTKPCRAAPTAPPPASRNAARAAARTTPGWSGENGWSAHSSETRCTRCRRSAAHLPTKSKRSTSGCRARARRGSPR